MFLLGSSRSPARRFTSVTALLVSIALAGCGIGGGGSAINEIIDAAIRAQSGALPTETAVILLVNQTDSTVVIDLLIDDELTTLSCTALEQRCEYIPPVCPSSIEAVEESYLNDQGAYIGGRIYDENPEFTFTEDEFDCKSTIVFTFSLDGTTAEKL